MTRAGPVTNMRRTAARGLRPAATVTARFGLAFAGAGCGGTGNDLWGSIGELFPLDFDKLAILKQDDALRLEYTKTTSNGIDKVLKLTLITTGLGLQDGSDLRDEAFVSAVTIERLVTDGGDFPTASAGQIHFERFGFTEGGTITGDFTVLFDDGRTLFGTFDGRVKTMSAS